jgi:transcription antitermination factor NusG
MEPNSVMSSGQIVQNGLFWGASSEVTQWFALYTRSRHEQLVKRLLDGKGIENFLPLHERTSQWTDRKKKLSLPLFPGYLFVRIASSNRLGVLKTPGAVYIVGNGIDLLPIPEEQIASIQSLVDRGLKYDPYPYIKIGSRVRIKDGPLSGVEGVLVRKKRRSCLVISVDIIQRSVSVETDGWSVERI